ncbi:MAG: RsmE family RNA methyltransferase [Saprospiraceae bacterium]|nr:16S rRNA (uracil(1498)-N(3))-methyltransferase [Saprospiraceae bacterium]
MELFIGHKINEKQFCLTQDEFHHCIRVTRHKIGDAILVTEFNGIIFNAKIIQINTQEAILEINGIFREENLHTTKISIAISPTQHMDRFEWFIEKAVENGVHEIIPLHCKRTENIKIKTDRLLKIITASAKQTLRPWIPRMQSLCAFENLFNTYDLQSQKFIGHCQDGLEGYLGKLYSPAANVLILIGPAGDFTTDEIKFAILNKCIPVSLGDYRLRTETAGLTALQILQTIRHLQL